MSAYADAELMALPVRSTARGRAPTGLNAQGDSPSAPGQAANELIFAAERRAAPISEVGGQPIIAGRFRP